MQVPATVRDGVHTPRRHDSADKHVAGSAIYADDTPEPRDLLLHLIARLPNIHIRHSRPLHPLSYDNSQKEGEHQGQLRAPSSQPFVDGANGER